MSTTYIPARSANTSAPMAYAATRYAGAAALCAAIRAAAELAPEYAPESEFPERYAPGLYPDKVAAQIEPGADLWVGSVSYTVVNGQRIGRDERERVTSEGPASVWPRAFTYAETPGPFLAPRADVRAVFAYSTPDGARGSLTVANLRGALLALADKVHANRGAFDGKAKRAARPSKPAGSSPHVTARALWDAKDFAGALHLAGNVGALYFGVSTGEGPRPYMGAESVEIAGHALTIARSIVSGYFHVLHTPSGLGIDTVKTGAPADGFKSHSLALAWVESKMAEDAFREKMDAGVSAVAAFDQSAALAHYMGADAAPDDETAAPVHAETAPATVAPETAPQAPAAPEAKTYPVIVARVVAPSPALIATDDCGYLSHAARRVRWAHRQAQEIARGILADNRGTYAEFCFSDKPGQRAPEALALRSQVAAQLREQREAKRGAALLARMYPAGVPANVRYVSAADFDAIPARMAAAAPGLPPATQSQIAPLTATPATQSQVAEIIPVGEAIELVPEVIEPAAAPATQSQIRARAFLLGQFAAMRPGPLLRIPRGDARQHIPARFAPVYVLRAGVQS